MATHLSSRIKFEQVVAAVLRMVDEYSLYRQLKPYINPKYFYANDTSDGVETLRYLLNLMSTLESENNLEKFSYPYIESQISIKLTNQEKAQKHHQVFCGWLRNDTIKGMIHDKGCWDSFVDYVKALQIFDIGDAFSTHIQKNEITDAVNKMNDALGRIARIGSYDKETIQEGELLKIIKDDNSEKDSKKALYLGNPLIDDLMGGFEQQTLNGFISVTNGGKTMMAHHLVARAVKQQMPVWVGVLEDRKKSFVYRVVSRLSGIPMRRLKKEFNQLSSHEKAAAKRAETEFYKYVRADFLYGCDIDTIHKASLDYDLECRLRNKPVPIVNIVDYTGHISGRSSGDKMYEKMRNAYGSRKDFVLKHDKIGFDFAQINREGSKNMSNNHVITQNDLAGSFDMAQVFDNLISINRNDDDVTASTSRLHMCKARDAAIGTTIKVKVEFHRAFYSMKNWEFVAGNAEALEISKHLAKEPGADDEAEFEIDRRTS